MCGIGDDDCEEARACRAWLSPMFGVCGPANAILCLDVHASNPNTVVTGGADNNVVLLDRASGQATNKMKGHSKKVGPCPRARVLSFCFVLRQWLVSEARSISSSAPCAVRCAAKEVACGSGRGGVDGTRGG